MPPKRSTTLQTLGHANGHLRGSLLEALNYPDWWKHVEIDFSLERHNRRWSRLSDRNRARWLIGQLWNSTDVVPSMERRKVRDRFANDPQPLTYADVARLLIRDLQSGTDETVDEDRQRWRGASCDENHC